MSPRFMSKSMGAGVGGCGQVVALGLAVIAIAILSTGCGGGSDGNSCDVPALFQTKCSGNGCHSPGPNMARELDLASAGVHERVANASGNGCVGTLADPSNPEGSLLYEKVAGMPTCDGQMPPGAPLSDAEVMCIRDWISGLSPPQDQRPDGGTECPECECLPDEVESCYNGPEGSAENGICRTGMRECVPDGSMWVWGPCDGEVTPRGENCNTPDDENCDGFTPDCTELWSLGFGSHLTEESAQTRAAAVDSSGNIYTIGHFNGVASFGGEPLVAAGFKTDIVLAKFDTYGNPIWSKRFGDSSNQYSSDLVVDDQDNVILLVRSFGTINFGGIVLDGPGADDISVAKLDSEGNHIWSRVFGGIDPDRAERVAVDSAGDVYVTGTFNNVVDFGGGAFTSAGLRDAVVLKLAAANGAHLWSKQIGGTGDEYGFGVDTDADGNVFVTGFFQNTITIGNDQHTSRGGYDIYVARLTSSGNYIWSRSYGSVEDDAAYDLAVDEPTGEFVITGYTGGTVDFGGGSIPGLGSKDLFVARFRGNASHVFSRVYGDEVDQFETSFDTNTWNAIEVDSAGNAILAGPLAGAATFDATTLTAAGRTDLLVAKLAPDGTFLSGAVYGGTGTELALGVAVDGVDNAILAGRFFGSTFNVGVAGSLQRTGPDQSDGFLIRITP